MTRARPLRFLALVLCGWVGARAVILSMPGGQAGDAIATKTARAAATARARSSNLSFPAISPGNSHAAMADAGALIRDKSYKTAASGRLSVRRLAVRLASVPAPPPVSSTWSAVVAAGPPAFRGGSPAALPPVRLAVAAASRSTGFLPSASPVPRRWAGSAWLLLRDDRGAASLAPGGTLGGSQAGARVTYRIGSGLALSGRAYVPLRRREAAEVAAGIDWRPSARLPIHLLAERRQDVGGEGRSAFALTLYGGANGRFPGGLRAEGYGQAGVVGTRSRDLFVDGSVRVALPVGPVEIGGGAWGAAQPGAARLDAGPSVSYRLPIRRANLRLLADWRFRIAGDAAPGSGPAFTLAADF